MTIPHIYMSHFSDRNHPQYQCLVVDSKLTYNVTDIQAFYEALGYTKDFNTSGTLEEEYFWKTFISPAASKHYECINFLLMTYLYNVCSEFREKYGTDYRNISGNCDFKKQDSQLPCLTCMNYPKNKIFHRK